jgi:hypothetical protein
LVKLANHGIATGGHQRGHVERRANRGASAPDEAFAAQRAAVAGQRGHPDEGGDLFAGQGAEFGQIANQRATDHGPDAGDRAQKILFRAPDGASLDGAVQVVIHIVEPALQPTNVLDDASADCRDGVLEPIAFGAHHPQDLTPSRQQRVQGLGAIVGQRAGIRPHSLSEEGQRVGVDPIRLGQLARGTSEVAHLPRIGYDQRQPSHRERGHGGALVSSGGLQDHERGRGLVQPSEQLLNACLIVGGGPVLP